MVDINKYKTALEKNAEFRENEMKRLTQLRGQSNDFNTISVCNLILNYIYELKWSEIARENTKKGAKYGFRYN